MKDFDPAELLQCLMDIARTGSRKHIAEEFQRCVASSIGSSEPAPRAYSPLPAPTRETPSPSGGAPSVLHTEDNWWVDQDRDEAWARQWENDTDTSDPKSWK